MPNIREHWDCGDCNDHNHRITILVIETSWNNKKKKNPEGRFLLILD